MSTTSRNNKHVSFLLCWIATLLFIPRLQAKIDYAGPACTGSLSNGCNCDNSRWECRDGYDALTMCPHGACFVSLKGQPTCGESYLCQPCKTDDDCLAPHEVCVWYGLANGTDCESNGYDCATQGSLCASTVLFELQAE